MKPKATLYSLNNFNAYLNLKLIGIYFLVPFCDLVPKSSFTGSSSNIDKFFTDNQTPTLNIVEHNIKPLAIVFMWNLEGKPIKEANFTRLN